VNKRFPSFGGRAVHNRSRFCEPGRSHDHSLSALPINFALLDALVLEMVEQAASQERQQGRRETMRLLMLEAIVTGDVAFGRRKKNNAEDSAAHGVSILVSFRRSAQLASSRPISSESLVILLEHAIDTSASLTTD
jgi:hypothetical protein